MVKMRNLKGKPVRQFHDGTESHLPVCHELLYTLSLCKERPHTLSGNTAEHKKPPQNSCAKDADRYLAN